MAPLSRANGVLEDLGGGIPFETCLAEAAERDAATDHANLLAALGVEVMVQGPKAPRPQGTMALGVLDVSVSRRLMLDEDQQSIPAGCLKAFDTRLLADWGRRWPLTPPPMMGPETFDEICRVIGCA